MKTYTVELAYTVLSTATVTVKARNFEDACAKAMAEEIDEFVDSSEPGDTYVLQLAEGDVELCNVPGALDNVPLDYRDEPERLRAGFHDTLAVLQRLVNMVEINWSDRELAGEANDAEALEAARDVIKRMEGKFA